MANDTTPAMNLIAEALTDFYGERCPNFAPGCTCCEAWAQYDEFMARPKMGEAREAPPFNPPENMPAARAARPEPEGMKTTAEERGAMRGMYQPASLERRLLRDIDHLLARLSALEAERDAAVAAEREACVRIADDYAAQKKAAAVNAHGFSQDELYAEVHAAENIADAIRARGGEHG